MTTIPADLTPPPVHEAQRWKIYLRNSAYIIAALLIFLFSIDLMIASLQHLGKAVSDVILLATANPFTGLFIGLLVTAIIQSSSATTSMVVALVATGSITLQGAVPIIMGANVGTTITSTIVSLSFITKKKEFQRAVAAGTYHDFFNILTVIILFPLEYYFGFLSGLSQALANYFFIQPSQQTITQFSLLGGLFNPIIHFLLGAINNFLLVGIAIVMLFGSILFFRKIITNILGLASQARFQQFFFKNTLKSFGWGLLTTAAIRSSTVTTSLVVPLVAKKVVKLKAATPFILGANVGTTITAFIASSFNSNAAISIALAHFLFNLIGVLIFLPLPYIKDIPVRLANGLGRLTLRYRLVGFSYLLMTFFFVPFALIFMSKNLVQVEEATYRKTEADGQQSQYSMLVRKYEGNQFSNWATEARESTDQSIVSIYRRKSILIVGNELFEFNKPGFCRDGEDEGGKYKICIREVIPSLALSETLNTKFVYVFEKQWYEPAKVDSVSVWCYLSARDNLLVKRETRNQYGIVLKKEELVKIEKR